MSFTDRLTKHSVELAEIYTAYRLEQVREVATRVEDLGGGHFLAVHVGEINIDYGFFSFLTSDMHDANAFYQCIWTGSGTGSSLREMRHTWFMPDETPDCKGYVFYLPIDATIKALTILKEYFDD